MNWDKAKRRDRQRIEKLRQQTDRATGRKRQQDEVRQLALQRFAERNNISCFSCHSRDGKRWAKSGFSKRGPWIVCVPCVARNKERIAAERSPG